MNVTIRDKIYNKNIFIVYVDRMATHRKYIHIWKDNKLTKYDKENYTLKSVSKL